MADPHECHDTGEASSPTRQALTDHITDPDPVDTGGYDAETEDLDQNLTVEDEAAEMVHDRLQEYKAQESPGYFRRRLDSSSVVLESLSKDDTTPVRHSQQMMDIGEFLRSEQPPEALRYVFDDQSEDDQLLGIQTVLELLVEVLAKLSSREPEQVRKTPIGQLNLESAIGITKKEARSFGKSVPTPLGSSFSTVSSDILSFPGPPGRDQADPGVSDAPGSAESAFRKRFRFFTKKDSPTKKKEPDSDSDSGWDFKCRGGDPTLCDEPQPDDASPKAYQRPANAQSSFSRGIRAAKPNWPLPSDSPQSAPSQIRSFPTPIQADLSHANDFVDYAPGPPSGAYGRPYAYAKPIADDAASAKSETTTIKPSTSVTDFAIEPSPTATDYAPTNEQTAASVSGADETKLGAAHSLASMSLSAGGQLLVDETRYAHGLIKGKETSEGEASTASHITKAKPQAKPKFSALPPRTKWGTHEYAPPGYVPPHLLPAANASIGRDQPTITASGQATSPQSHLTTPTTPGLQTGSIRGRVASILPRMSFLSLADPISSTELELSPAYNTPEKVTPEKTESTPSKSKASAKSSWNPFKSSFGDSAEKKEEGTCKSPTHETPTKLPKSKSKDELRSLGTATSSFAASKEETRSSGTATSSFALSENDTIPDSEPELLTAPLEILSFDQKQKRLRQNLGLPPVPIPRTEPNHQKNMKHDFEWYHQNIWCYLCTPVIHNSPSAARKKPQAAVKNTLAAPQTKLSVHERSDSAATVTPKTTGNRKKRNSKKSKGAKPAGGSDSTPSEANTAGAEAGSSQQGSVPKGQLFSDVVLPEDKPGPVYCHGCNGACCMWAALTTCVGAWLYTDPTAGGLRPPPPGRPAPQPLGTIENTPMTNVMRLPGPRPSEYSMSHNAFDQLENIESVFGRGPDPVRTFQRCTHCYELFCPNCCGRCVIMLCGMVMCNKCVAEGKGKEDGPQGRSVGESKWKCIWH